MDELNARCNVRSSMTDEAIKDIQCLRQIRSNVRAPMDESPLVDNKNQPLIPTAPYLMNADIHLDKKTRAMKTHTN